MAKILFITLCTFFLLGCSPEISDRLAKEISNSQTDLAIVSSKKALFVFKVDPQQQWEWHITRVPPNELEYGWWTDFELNGKNYLCGVYLYKHPFSNKSTGSLKELIESGQADFRSVEKVIKQRPNNGDSYAKEVVKQKKHPRVKSIVESGSVIVLLEEQNIVNQLRKLRPDSVQFNRVNPSVGTTDRRNIAVSYTAH